MPVPRPTNRGEAIRHVKAIYGEQKWKEPEQAVNATMLGLEFKAVQFYSNEELKIILDDFEKFGMIIYEK